MNMDPKLPSVKRNAILNSIRAVMSVLFPLITYPYVTRLLQAENLGKVNFASTFVGYFSLIAGLGISSYGTREGVQYRSDRKQLNRFCGELLTLNLITTAVALLLLLSTVIVPKLRGYAPLLAIYSTTILFSAIGMEWLYSLEEDYLYVTTRSILIQLVSVALMLLLVKDAQDFYIYAAINAFASVGANFFNFCYCKRYIDIKLCFDLKKVFRHLKSCMIFFSSSIASSIYSNIGTTMLGFFTTNYHIGIYAVAVKIYTVIKTVLSAVISVMMPRLTYYRTHSMEPEFNALVSKIIKALLTVLLPAVAGVNLVADELILVICGEGFREAAMTLRILSLAIMFAMFAAVINGCILLPCKKEKKALASTVSAAAVNLVTNFAAIPLFQQNGAAATTVLSEMVVMLVGWKHARHLVKLEKMGKVISTGLIGCAAMLAVSIVLEKLISQIGLLLIAKVVICAAVYLLLLVLLDHEIVADEVKKMIKRLSNHRKG